MTISLLTDVKLRDLIMRLDEAGHTLDAMFYADDELGAEIESVSNTIEAVADYLRDLRDARDRQGAGVP